MVCCRAFTIKYLSDKDHGFIVARTLYCADG